MLVAVKGIGRDHAKFSPVGMYMYLDSGRNLSAGVAVTVTEEEFLLQVVLCGLFDSFVFLVDLLVSHCLL